MICYVAGITTIVWLPVMPSPLFIAPLVFVLPVCWRLDRRLFAYLLAIAWALGWCYWQMAHRLDASELRADWIVEGEVTGLPSRYGDSVRFELDLHSITPLNAAIELRSKPPRRLTLSWYQPSHPVRSGDLVKLEARLKAPHGYANPDAADYELRALAKGVDATGYVRQMLSHKEPSRCQVGCLRERVVNLIAGRYSDERDSGLLRALIIGDRGGVSPQQWEVLARTGTLHLAVISGLHIGFAALAGVAAFHLLQRLVVLRHPRVVLAIAAVLPALGYTLLAGAALPTQRALLMLVVFVVAYWRLWSIDLWTRWWIAMAGVLTLSPVAVHQAGFWLSFMAVASILWSVQRSRRGASAWHAQLILTISMAPVLLYAFGGVSLVAPLVNLLAIPLVGFLLISAALDVCLALIDVSALITWVEWLCELFWRLVEFGAAWQGDIWRPSGISLTGVVLCGIGTVLMLQPYGVPLRFLGVLLYLPLVFGVVERESQKGFEAWVFDVGQGLAVLIDVDGRYLLYDTGPAFPGGGSAFTAAVTPFLQARGITYLDRVVLSHNDIDHSGGYAALERVAKPGDGLTGSPELLDKPRFSVCKAGIGWHWRDVAFEILAGGQGANDNNRSCVLRVSDGHCTLLLTGDVDSTVERALPRPLKALDWLVAGHHGSKHSTAEAFLRDWQPRDVIFSAGYANRFGHPAPEVLKRVDVTGARIHSTAMHGALHLQRDRSGRCAVKRWRDTKRRFWSGY